MVLLSDSGRSYTCADGAVEGTLIRGFDISVVDAQAGEGLGDQRLDLPSELGGDRTLKFHLQAVARSDLDHDVSRLQGAGHGVFDFHVI